MLNISKNFQSIISLEYNNKYKRFLKIYEHKIWKIFFNGTYEKSFKIFLENYRRNTD